MSFPVPRDFEAKIDIPGAGPCMFNAIAVHCALDKKRYCTILAKRSHCVSTVLAE